MSSAVAGIIDPYGGLRVVVSEPSRMVCHCRCDELLFVVPDLWTEEPVPWNDISWMIRRVEWHIAEWIRSRNDPEALEHPCIKLYQIRCRKTDHKRTTNLDAIVQT